MLDAGQVGDRARHLEHAVIGARRQTQPRDRLLEQRLALRIRRAVTVDLARRRAARWACPAARAARARAAATRARIACGGLAAGVLRIRSSCTGRRHLDLQVDAVEQRPGDARAVARNLVRRAAAAAVGVAEITAGAGIHRRDQLEARREIRLARGARDGDAPGLERLAQHLEHAALELRQLVQEQHAVVRERNLARPRIAAAAHQRHAGGGVMRRAERAPLPARTSKPAAADRLDRRGLERLLLASSAAGCRASAARAWSCRCRAGRSAAGCGRRPRRFRARAWLRLAFHVAQIRVRYSPARLQRAARSASALAPGQMRADFEQGARRHGSPRGSASAASAAFAAGSTKAAAVARYARASWRARRAPGAARRSAPARRRIHIRASWRVGNLPGGGEDAERDRQIEAPALLGQIGGREIDGDAPRREIRIAAFSSAARTRSLASFTSVSGRPTMVKLGSPLARCTSTVTSGASMPARARL